MDAKFEYWVIIEPHNGSPFVDKLKSSKEKTNDEIFSFCEEKYDLDYERDSISIVEKPDEIWVD